MNETILSWNVTNWITVTLMVFLGFVVIGAAGQAYQGWKSRADG